MAAQHLAGGSAAVLPPVADDMVHVTLSREQGAAARRSWLAAAGRSGSGSGSSDRCSNGRGGSGSLSRGSSTRVMQIVREMSTELKELSGSSYQNLGEGGAIAGEGGAKPEDRKTDGHDSVSA